MERLISCFGLFVMIGLAWLMSSHKRQVSGRMVVGGLLGLKMATNEFVAYQRLAV